MSSAASEDLYSESLRIESKIIYADLRVNARGRYLKLSETGSKRLRSTVLLPGPGIKWVYSLIDYYIGECAAGRQPANKELAVENKVFHFSAGSNERGRFLRISESGVSHSSGRHTLVIPCGGEELTGWVALRDCIRRVAALDEGEQQPGAAPQEQQQPGEGSSEPQQPQLLDVTVGPVVGPGHPPPSLTTSPQGTPVLSCHGRRVFFDVGSTVRGSYMRITEVAHQDRSTIVIPAVAVPQFREAVDTCATLLEQQAQQQPQQQQPQQPPQQLPQQPPTQRHQQQQQPRH
ncbi:transcription factor [Raphidocelis subcapitata]|uniref:Transcription factor n=1 Tax=Raphidocelis subcapitata TaxID=307507 RepID=A0A2V0PB34_9CHLO|nr:transcription factor [Raphidocelis subcapitata]|eukprot:GBF95090.1 transcription factor [Raphidocelis subcapitata]